jgi:GAF domain-containing protein
MFPVFATLGDLLIQRLPLTLSNLVQVQKSTALHWVIDTAPFFLGLFASFAGRRQDQLSVLNRELNEQVQARDQVIGDLRALQDSLGIHSQYLEAIAEVAQSASSISDDPQAFSSRAATIISQRLGFYHVGIFVLDDTGEWAELIAASSEGGQRLRALGHRLRVGQQGIVGYVSGTGQPRIAPDVSADAMFVADQELPDTRSEMALPLRARGEIIGVLDVQSLEPEAFGEDDIVVLRALADQIAVAINNAGLFEQARESLEAAQRAYGELTREAWTELLRTESGQGYYCDETGVVSLVDRSADIAQTALPEASIPLSVRGRVIGAITGHKGERAGEWTEQEMALLEALGDQLGEALENARLYQDTQRRAAQDRMVSQATGRMRESLDIQTVLQVAVREISQSLGLAALDVRLGVDADEARE